MDDHDRPAWIDPRDYCAVHSEIELDPDPIRGLVCRACDDEVAASVLGLVRRCWLAFRDRFLAFKPGTRLERLRRLE